MHKKNLRRVFKKKWGNSILSVNVKYWSCDYCGKLLREDTPFAIVHVNGSVRPADAKVFDAEFCLKTFIIKKEALRIDK